RRRPRHGTVAAPRRGRRSPRHARTRGARRRRAGGEAQPRGRCRDPARGPRRRALMPVPLVTRILVADDHPIVRSGLKMILDAQPDLQVVAESEDGADAVRKALAADVDLAILDVAMPKLTGIQAAAELHKRMPELKLLML